MLLIIKLRKMQILCIYIYYKLSENLNKFKAVFNELIVFEKVKLVNW